MTDLSKQSHELEPIACGLMDTKPFALKSEFNDPSPKPQTLDTYLINIYHVKIYADRGILSVLIDALRCRPEGTPLNPKPSNPKS